MAKTFYLVRHTEYDNPRGILHGRLPISLSAVGMGQAKKIGQWFQDKNISKIYSSAVFRCRQTTELINESLAVPVIYDQRLLEDLTVMQGMLLEEYRKYDDGPYTFQAELGGELPADIQGRMVNFWQEKIQSEEGNIIILSHGDPLMFLHLALVGEKLPAVHDMVNLRKVLHGHEYPSKGSIGPVIIDGATIQVQDLITI